MKIDEIDENLDENGGKEVKTTAKKKRVRLHTERPARLVPSLEGNYFGCGNIALEAPATTGTCNLQARRGLDLRAWVVGGVVCGKRRN
jgi:hypothetical protein